MVTTVVSCGTPPGTASLKIPIRSFSRASRLQPVRSSPSSWRFSLFVWESPSSRCLRLIRQSSSHSTVVQLFSSRQLVNKRRLSMKNLLLVLRTLESTHCGALSVLLVASSAHAVPAVSANLLTTPFTQTGLGPPAHTLMSSGVIREKLRPLAPTTTARCKDTSSSTLRFPIQMRQTLTQYPCPASPLHASQRLNLARKPSSTLTTVVQLARMTRLHTSVVPPLTVLAPSRRLRRRLCLHPRIPWGTHCASIHLRRIPSPFFHTIPQLRGCAPHRLVSAYQLELTMTPLTAHLRRQRCHRSPPSCRSTTSPYDARNTDDFHARGVPETIPREIMWTTWKKASLSGTQGETLTARRRTPLRHPTPQSELSAW
jgi:hypothetical protein